MRRQAREESRSRRKVQQDQIPDTKIGKTILMSFLLFYSFCFFITAIIKNIILLNINVDKYKDK